MHLQYLGELEENLDHLEAGWYCPRQSPKLQAATQNFRMSDKGREVEAGIGVYSRHDRCMIYLPTPSDP